VPVPELTSGEAVVDLAAIATNTGVACSRTRSTVMAVVKANGFGHGAVAVARTALAHGAGWLGVATPGEALALRSAGISAPILCWLYVVLYRYLFSGPAGGLTAVAFPVAGEVARYGYLGVDLFLVISGFVVLMTAWNRSPSGFVVSRAVRLYPA
jgi:hypothetical protein